MEKPKVVQFEITGRDGTGLQQFYEGLFGWELQGRAGYRRTSASETGLPGAVGSTKSGPNLGRGEGWDGGAGQVTIYVEVFDLRESIAMAERLGGKVIASPYDVPGRELTLAFIADPEGHVIGLSQGLEKAIEEAGLAR